MRRRDERLKIVYGAFLFTEQTIKVCRRSPCALAQGRIPIHLFFISFNPSNDSHKKRANFLLDQSFSVEVKRVIPVIVRRFYSFFIKIDFQGVATFRLFLGVLGGVDLCLVNKRLQSELVSAKRKN